MYYKADKKLLTQSVHFGRFVSRAQKRQKCPIFLRGNSSYPLRRDVVDSAFLQPVETPTPAAKVHFDPSPDIFLSSFRTPFVAFVRRHHGPAPHQQDRYPAIQRRVPGDAGAGSIPRPGYAAPIPSPTASQKHSPIGPASRQLAHPTLGYAQTALQLPLRSGCDRVHHLRQSTGFPRGIQSQETRTAFLSTLLLFQKSKSGDTSLN